MQSILQRIFGITAIIVLLFLAAEYQNIHLIPQVSVQSIISNRHIVSIILSTRRARDIHNNNDEYDILSNSVVASFPKPLKNSTFYQHVGQLDILQEREGRIYFLVPNIRRLASHALFFPNIQLEQDWSQQIHNKYRNLEHDAMTDTIADDETIGKRISDDNIAPIYPSISPYFYCYRNLQGSYMTLEHLEKSYPDLVKVITIGPSYLKSVGEGGHDIKVLLMTNRNKTVEDVSLPPSPPLAKSPLFILCGIHSREITPTEACARFAEDILEGYGKDADKTWILDYTEIHMVIQANPDGREDEENQLAQNNLSYMRRKNMNECKHCFFKCFNDDGSRFGVDLNRNFPHSQWGTVGISGRCDGSYPGRFAASEVETISIVEYIESILPPGFNTIDTTTGAYTRDSKGVLIDVHSYGEDFFWPYGYTGEKLAPNNEELKKLAEKMSLLTIPQYSTNNEVYLTSGDSTDWAYEAVGVASYTVEIGTDWYEPCDNYEKFTNGNVMRILLYAARISKAPYSLPMGPEINSISLSNTIITSSELLKATISTEFVDIFQPVTDKVYSISLYIDHHPYEMIEGQFDNTYEIITTDNEAEFSVPMSGLSRGKHFIYAQARNETFYGPVYSTFFEVVA